MNLSYYDFNPGILGLAIWGIISYLFRKKKIQNKSKLEEVLVKEESSNLDYFENIIEPQDISINEDLSILMDSSFENMNVPSEMQTEEISKKELPIDKPLIIDSKKRIKSEIKLLSMLKDEESLKSAFIMKEILDKPLSLRNYD